MKMPHALVTIALFAAGCAADADPVEVDLVVERAGAEAPVGAGAQCTLRAQPAWRQGVNCQIVLSCDGAARDLFGGERAGGYAVCTTAERRFVDALDDRAASDGDPAIHVDFASGVVTWRDRGESEVALRARDAFRPIEPWDPQ